MNASLVAKSVEASVVNFVVLGERRSGSSVVRGAINSTPLAYCHLNLLHPVEEVRRADHEAYFGPSKDPDKLPEWYEPDVTNPYQYINHRVLDNPLRGERAIGLRLTYDVVGRHELHDLFERRANEGDFCLIHVVRNPVACFVSQKQAERHGLWSRGLNDPPAAFVPQTVQIDPEELTAFVRAWVGVRGKAARACDAPDSHMEVHYRDIHFDFQGTAARVIDFLELPEPLVPFRPPTLRLRNRSMRERVSDFWRLRADLPQDVRAFTDGKDFY